MQLVSSAIYAYIIFHELLSLKERLGMVIVIIGIFFAKKLN
ncbi:hypothetical protein [Candidatus Schmidhempelia bombi]|nr:hypothetical protein [Candidatus Schmidhempelia bombi]